MSYLSLLNTIKFNIIKAKSGRYKGMEVCDDIFTFDIETTSYYIKENGEIVSYDYDNPDEMKKCEKGALCYHWQFSINDIVITGRELKQFAEFLMYLNIYCPALKIIYVHNLSFEFQFLLNIFKFDKAFARNSHKPITATVNKYNIEFRCSYMLTRLSLNSWSKKLPVKKLKGDLDYDVIRTPLTPLTDKEKAYCVNDCLVVYHGIKKFRNEYGNVYKIPLTQTGEVRRVVKEKLSKNYYWLKKCQSLLPKTLDEFKDQIAAFIGGTVIANSIYKNTTVSNVIMYDIASSYPWVMISEMYPVTPFEKITSNYKKYLNDEYYTYLINFTATNVEAKTWCKFLSKSKIISGTVEEADNGRIVRASELTVTLTKPDYEIFKKCYKAQIKINYMKVSKLRYLPDEFRKYVIELYNNKTTLKDVPNMDDLYMKSKQYVNSLFGLMVTKEISDEFHFDGIDWVKIPLDENTFYSKLESKQKSLSKNFLSFQFGIFVTAYARRNLWRAILELDKYVVYCDTDSVKYIGDIETNFFADYNYNVMKKHEKIANELNIPVDKLSPKNPFGKKCYIGIYECENPKSNNEILPINEFRTLGAKKYIYRDPKSNELKMTLAGVPKGAVKCLNNDINEFRIDNEFTQKGLKEANVSKLTPYYLTEISPIKFPDGYYNRYRYGITLTPTSYNLSITPSDLLLLFLLYYEDDSSLLQPRDLSEIRNKLMNNKKYRKVVEDYEEVL